MKLEDCRCPASIEREEILRDFQIEGDDSVRDIVERTTASAVSLRDKLQTRSKEVDAYLDRETSEGKWTPAQVIRELRAEVQSMQERVKELLPLRDAVGKLAKENTTLKAYNEQLFRERNALEEVRQHGCDCSDDDACLFARQRDAALAELAKSLLRPFADADTDDMMVFGLDVACVEARWFLDADNESGEE